MEKKTKKIDIHMHLRQGAMQNHVGADSAFMTPEEALVKYENLGVESGVILPMVSPEYTLDTLSNQSAMNIVNNYKGKFHWFCNVDPRMVTNKPDSDLSYVLEFYKSHGAKGVGEICANLYFDDPYVENLFYHCEKCNMPVLFHIGPEKGGCYGLIDDLGLPRLEKALKKFPNLMFLGHSQPFWAEIGLNVNGSSRNDYPIGKVIPGKVVELMSKYSNLYGDLSAGSGFNAVSRDPEFGYNFIEEFQDRLVFGTDICSPTDDIRLSFWLDDAVENGKISQNAYSKVCRENALRILK